MFEATNEAFQYVNEELQLRQEEAQARALQKQRTLVFNMVKSDVKVIQGTLDTLEHRVEVLQNNIDAQ